MPTRTTKPKVRYQPVLNRPKRLDEEFVAIRDNIAVNDLLVLILVDEFGYDCPYPLAGIRVQDTNTW
jgi:hypothetical protein